MGRSLLVSTWNVNSIRAREERFFKWLKLREPDIVCIQELKAVDDVFPFQAIKAAGYEAAVFGQKTYNGVAIIARGKTTDVERGFGDGAEDPEARFIAGTIEGVRVCSTYVPNGRRVDSEKYAYKLEWLQRLLRYLERCELDSRPFLLCGDLNIAPDVKDVANPESWEGGVLFSEELSGRFDELIGAGLVDAFRIHHRRGGHFSWWDYRRLGFQRNNGLRIDHILASRALADRCTETAIDRDERKGFKPSDHAPVLAAFDWP